MRKIKKAFKKHIANTRGIKNISVKSVRRFKSPTTSTTRYMVQFTFNDIVGTHESIGAYPPLPKDLMLNI